MSDTSARARRLALAFGSLARKGLIGARAGVALPATGVAARGVAALGVADRGVGEPGSVARTGAGVDLGAAFTRGAAVADGVGRTAGPENGGVTRRLCIAGVGRVGGAAAGRAKGAATGATGAAGRVNGAGAAAVPAAGPRGANGAGGDIA